MHDEYNHKQRLMQTYIGFKKEENTEDNIFFEKLKEIVVNTVAENPNKKFKEQKPIYSELLNKCRAIMKPEKAKIEPVSKETN